MAEWGRFEANNYINLPIVLLNFFLNLGKSLSLGHMELIEKSFCIQPRKLGLQKINPTRKKLRDPTQLSFPKNPFVCPVRIRDYPYIPTEYLDIGMKKTIILGRETWIQVVWGTSPRCDFVKISKCEANCAVSADWAPDGRNLDWVVKHLEPSCGA